MNAVAVLATTAEGSTMPTWWLSVGVPLAILGLAIAYAANRSSRLQRWHDDATLLYERGAELGEAARMWASHPGAAGTETWAELQDRDAHVAAQARRLGTRAPGDAQRQRALEVARAASVLGERLQHPQPAGGAHVDHQPDGAEILAAASSLDAALLALRSAV
jgi:hypothetical protein